MNQINIKAVLEALQNGEMSLENAKRILKGETNNATENLPVKNNLIASLVVTLEEIEPGIALVKMQDTKNKNTFSGELIKGLLDAFECINKHEHFKVVILTGYDSYFASGGTQEGLMQIYEGTLKYSDTNLYRLGMDCKVPVIAAIQGHGIGAGWAMGMLCDMVIMSEESYYAANFMKFGFTPGAGATTSFIDKFGSTLGMEILFSARKYQGKELRNYNISFPIIPRNDVVTKALLIAREISEGRRDAILILKEHMMGAARKKLDAAVQQEVRMHQQTFVQQDAVKEGIEKKYGQQLNHPEAAPTKGNNEQTAGAANDPLKQKQEARSAIDKKDIAIISISGKYPQSDNLEQLWSNLQEGKDCISEIPEERWDYETNFNPDKTLPGKYPSKWGGFLEGIDQFDPLFFNVSPKVAQTMDPMERLFLETTWNLLEEAGITKETIKSTYKSNVGVFVGAMYQHYQLLTNDEHKKSVMSLSSYSAIANRISYFFDLRGPSLAVDTACSSALTAIHLACESLWLENCELAIAGGVNLTIYEGKYKGLNVLQMLASQNHSGSFADGDGFIPAEGVGAVLLKPLQKAIEDNDNIMGVIKGSFINHNGFTEGFGVPGEKAQVELMTKNLQKFNIEPESISLIESASNGSRLGDEMEINSLKAVFKNKPGYTCAIGAIKPNIGHAEAASGISQLSKVILQFKYKKIAPVIKKNNQNPAITIENTPFYFPSTLTDWDRPARKQNGKIIELPRRAVINAFGAGGANAQLIVEEYISAVETKKLKEDDQPHIIVLSVKKEKLLKKAARNLLQFLDQNTDVTLSNLAFTLQQGREPMRARWATVVTTLDELKNALHHYLNATTSVKKYSTNTLTDTEFQKADSHSEEPGKQQFTRTIEKTAAEWLAGKFSFWNTVPHRAHGKIVTLPTYPFDKMRCWLPDMATHHAIIQLNEDVSLKHPEMENSGSVPQEFIKSFFINELNVTQSDVSLDQHMHEFGVDSIIRIKLSRELNKKFNVKLSGRELLENSTINTLAGCLKQKLEEQYLLSNN